VQTSYPSWGYMFHQTDEVEATTLWELWNSPTGNPSMDSRNHIMFGSIGAWFYSYLAGINIGSPTVIAPPALGVNIPISRVSAKIDTPNGIVESSWSSQGGKQCVQISNARLSGALTARTLSNSPCLIDETVLNCGVEGRKSFIEKIQIGKTCENTAIFNSKAVREVLEACIGQQSCCFNKKKVMSLYRANEDNSFSDYDSLFVQMGCSTPASFSLNVTIPVGSTSVVRVPVMPNSSKFVITEGKTVIWKNGFVPGDPGVQGASRNGDNKSIDVQVGSGSYVFNVVHA